jgi:hypothetical protein
MQLQMQTTAIWDHLDLSVQRSLRWMPPEQMTSGVMNELADIYSFGMTTYEVRAVKSVRTNSETIFQILSSHPPFYTLADNLVYDAVINEGQRPPRPTESSEIGLSDLLWALVTDCWSQDPATRPGSGPLRDRILLLESSRADSTFARMYYLSINVIIINPIWKANTVLCNQPSMLQSR